MKKNIKDGIEFGEAVDQSGKLFWIFDQEEKLKNVFLEHQVNLASVAILLELFNSFYWELSSIAAKRTNETIQNLVSQFSLDARPFKSITIVVDETNPGENNKFHYQGHAASELEFLIRMALRKYHHWTNQTDSTPVKKVNPKNRPRSTEATVRTKWIVTIAKCVLRNQAMPEASSKQKAIELIHVTCSELGMGIGKATIASVVYSIN